MLEPEWTGRRVSVRRVVERAPDGRLLQGDVVGDLVGLDAQTALVRTRDGLVEVPVALVTAARLVDPSTRDVLDLQEVAGRGLRATHSRELDGWLLRADVASRPRRVNSVLPHAQLRVPLDDALAQTHEWYAGLGRAAVVLIPYPARRLLDAALADRGWTHEAPADVLVTDVQRLPRPEIGPVQLAPGPDARWLALAGGDATLLTRHDTVTFASIRSADGEPLAAGRGSVDAGWLAVTSLVVAQSERRRGLASRITAALGAWGADRGATRVYLQVETGNAAAQAFYRALGFTLHHTYHYRREP